MWARRDRDTTYSLTRGNLEDLGWEPDGALHAELLVFGAVDEVIRDCPNVCIRQALTIRHSRSNTRRTNISQGSGRCC